MSTDKAEEASSTTQPPITVKKNARKFIARSDVEAKVYQTEFDRNVRLGYKLICVNGYTFNSELKFLTIWEKKIGVASVPWIAKHHMSATEFQNSLNEKNSTKFRLTYLSAHAVDKEAYYSAIWEEIDGEVPLVHFGMTEEEYQNKLNSLKTEGYRLVFLNAYTVDGDGYYAAIFDKSTVLDWYTEHKMTPENYKIKYDEMYAKGYELVCVSGYYETKYLFWKYEYYAALWIKTTLSPSKLWIGNYNISEDVFQDVFDNLKYQGYVPKYVNAFVSNSTLKFNGIWENPYMKREDLKLLDDAVEDYLKEHNVTGISFAVSKDERLVFAKAYGVAKKSTGEPLSANHSLRIMSVSKTITALGVMKLLEKGLLKSLDMKVFGNDSVFELKYELPVDNAKNLQEITVRQLLNHTAGVKTCFTEKVFRSKHSTYDEVMNFFLNEKDLFTFAPGNQFLYSNVGYFILGRVIEHLSNISYEQFIRENILNPCQIGFSMYVGKSCGTPMNSREAHYDPPIDPNLRMFDAFGGWVARPIDLLKIMVRIDGESNKPDILSPSFINEMTSTTCFYGLGLIVKGKEYGHNGSGICSRSFFWKGLNGICFAVIVNSRPKDDLDTVKLKRKLHNAIDAVSEWPSYDLF